MAKEENRQSRIVKTSIIGICANVVLALGKAIIGIFTHSIAITLDALNNLSDALSNGITILSAKLSGRLPDKKHPFGYGRIEYISQMIIACIVLYAGIISFLESIQKIANPETVTYTPVSLIILAFAIVIKLLLGSYVKKKGKQLNSGSLIASGTDAFFDSILSFSVLVSAIIYLISNIQLEAYVGTVISCFIIKSGIEIIKDAVDEMIGIRSAKGLSNAIKKTVLEEENVKGVFDVIIHSYGPDYHIASFHIEVPDSLTASEIDLMTRRIQAKVYQELSILISAIGIYSVNTKEEETIRALEKIRHLSLEEEGVLQLHGFSFDSKNKRILFDLVMDFTVNDKQKVIQKIQSQIEELYPDYEIHITIDTSFSD